MPRAMASPRPAPPSGSRRSGRRPAERDLEHPVDINVCDTTAFVTDRQIHEVVVVNHVDLDRTLMWGVPDRVAQEIADDPGQGVGIDVDERTVNLQTRLGEVNTLRTGDRCGT